MFPCPFCPPKEGNCTKIALRAEGCFDILMESRACPGNLGQETWLNIQDLRMILIQGMLFWLWSSLWEQGWDSLDVQSWWEGALRAEFPLREVVFKWDFWLLRLLPWGLQQRGKPGTAPAPAPGTKLAQNAFPRIVPCCQQGSAQLHLSAGLTLTAGLAG